MGEQRLPPFPTPTFKTLYLSDPPCGVLEVGTSGTSFRVELKGLLLRPGEQEYPAPPKCTSPCAPAPWHTHVPCCLGPGSLGATLKWGEVREHGGACS